MVFGAWIMMLTVRGLQVRMNAINDSFILRSGVSWFLNRAFSSESCYVQLVEMFREVLQLCAK